MYWFDAVNILLSHVQDSRRFYSLINDKGIDPRADASSLAINSTFRICYFRTKTVVFLYLFCCQIAHSCS